MSERAELTEWLDTFYRQVFVQPHLVASARAIIYGAVDGFCARHGTTPVAGERKLYEEAIWYVNDHGTIGKDMGLEDKRIEVMEHLERLNLRAGG